MGQPIDNKSLFKDFFLVKKEKRPYNQIGWYITDEINKTEEFFKHLSELNIKRKQRIKVLNLIETWNFISVEKKQEFAERILDLAEGYERSQINDNIIEECNKKGHDYGQWSKNIYNNEEYWIRKCKRCDHIEQTNNNPLIEKQKRRIFKIKKPF